MPSKYRIVRREWFDLHNVKHVQFEPQSRFLWVFWCGFVVEDCGFTWNRRFDTIKEAEDFIRQLRPA